jgi:glycine/D-amino acid oxidase-like deaminating enzyme
MKTIPFWTDDFPRPDDLPVANELPEQVDVAIIGSGYTGLSAARVLARSGANVAVFERDSIGWGASSRNGGMTMPGLKQGIRTVFKWYGPELGREFWQASLDAMELIDQIVVEEDIDCDWHLKGYVALAYKASHFEDMQQSAAWHKQHLEHTLHVIGRDELHDEIGSAAFYGALASDQGGSIHPAKYVFGLARAAARHGASLYEGVEVTRIERQPSGFVLATSKGSLKSLQVVIATNGYTNSLLPKLQVRIFPVGSYCIVTEPLPPPLQAALSPKERMFYDSKRFLNYFRLTPDGRLLWGGRNNLSTNLDLQESAAILQAQMVQTFPELADIPITHSWTGQLGLTFDLLPHIGFIDGVHYALGYGGHGLSMATYLGHEIGLLLSGQKSRSPFAEIPHNGRWFYPRARRNGRPWFIPFAAQYYRFLDWIS